MQLRQLTADEVEFVVDTEDEDIPIQGNYMASGDDELDRTAEQELLDRIHRGDNSAWCVLIVQAKWKGWTGTATLGAYVFPEGNSWEENLAYAEDDIESLKEEAVSNLNSVLQQRSTVPPEIAALAGKP